MLKFLKCIRQVFLEIFTYAKVWIRSNGRMDKNKHGVTRAFRIVSMKLDEMAHSDHKRGEG